jgi:hypothetical protein
MNKERQYVRIDEHGVMRIGHSRVMLDAIVAGCSSKVILPKRFNSSILR